MAGRPSHVGDGAQLGTGVVVDSLRLEEDESAEVSPEVCHRIAAVSATRL